MMGYRCYIHPVNGSDPDCGDDPCIGKLIGYVDDEHINDLSVLPFIAYGLQYGQQHGANLDVDTFNDVCADLDRWGYKSLGEYMDCCIGQRILIPWYMLIPFLIAYYNDQQRYYITHNKQPLLDPAKLPQAVETVLHYYSDIITIDTDEWQNVQEFIIYWV